MNRSFQLLTATVLLTSAIMAQPKVSLDKSDIDFGIMYRGDVKKTSFTIKNIGTEPLKILQVLPSCGCTALRKPKDVLAPGEEDLVEVEFSSATFRGRVESKRVDILTNDPLAEYVSVRLTADVREELEPVGGTSLVWFGTVNVGTRSEQKIAFKNVTDKPISILSMPASNPRFSVSTPKKKLAPNETVEITITVSADKEGYTADHIDLITDSKNQSKVTINVSYIGLKGS